MQKRKGDADLPHCGPIAASSVGSCSAGNVGQIQSEAYLGGHQVTNHESQETKWQRHTFVIAPRAVPCQADQDRPERA